MIAETPIVFPSSSTMLFGVIVRETPNSRARQIGVIVTGSWLTVKEQMALLYARRTPIGKVVTDRLRPEGKRDEQGVEEARRLIRSAYDVIEPQLGERQFIVGDSFTIADCAAAPALWYGVRNVPLDGRYPRIAAYLAQLKQRPSFARALRESEPLFHLYPGD